MDTRDGGGGGYVKSRRKRSKEKLDFFIFIF
jgi:hypothetical protein